MEQCIELRQKRTDTQRARETGMERQKQIECVLVIVLGLFLCYLAKIRDAETSGFEYSLL